MNILLINAGAKNHGATQEILNTIKNQISTSNHITSICLGELNINYCKGCKICYETCSCVIDDDVLRIIDEIDKSDIIIIAAPSYWADIPGQFKVFIDRCTAFSDTNINPNRRKLKSGKICYGISLRAGTRPVECEHIIESIKHWCGHMNIDMFDSFFFCEINDENDIEKHKDFICKKADEWTNRMN